MANRECAVYPPFFTYLQLFKNIGRNLTAEQQILFAQQVDVLRMRFSCYVELTARRKAVAIFLASGDSKKRQAAMANFCGIMSYALLNLLFNQAVIRQGKIPVTMLTMQFPNDGHEVMLLNGFPTIDCLDLAKLPDNVLLCNPMRGDVESDRTKVIMYLQKLFSRKNIRTAVQANYVIDETIFCPDLQKLVQGMDAAFKEEALAPEYLGTFDKFLRQAVQDINKKYPEKVEEAKRIINGKYPPADNAQLFAAMLPGNSGAVVAAEAKQAAFPAARVFNNNQVAKRSPRQRRIEIGISAVFESTIDRSYWITEERDEIFIRLASQFPNYMTEYFVKVSPHVHSQVPGALTKAVFGHIAELETTLANSDPNKQYAIVTVALFILHYWEYSAALDDHTEKLSAQETARVYQRFSEKIAFFKQLRSQLIGPAQVAPLSQPSVSVSSSSSASSPSSSSAALFSDSAPARVTSNPAARTAAAPATSPPLQKGVERSEGGFTMSPGSPAT